MCEIEETSQNKRGNTKKKGGKITYKLTTFPWELQAIPNHFEQSFLRVQEDNWAFPHILVDLKLRSTEAGDKGKEK